MRKRPMNVIRKAIPTVLISTTLLLSSCAPRYLIQPSGDREYIVNAGDKIIKKSGEVWDIHYDGVLQSKEKYDRWRAMVDKYTAAHIE